jgi:NitT/TauT family transport system substrate-binding protein
MVRRMKSLVYLLAVLFLMTAVAGCGPKAAKNDSQELEKVVFAVPHKEIGPGTEAICYAVPKQLGYFKEEGLEVEMLNAEGSTVSLQLIGAGKAHTGQGNPSGVFNGIVEGVPVISTYNLIPKYGSGLCVLDSSPIKTVKDLKKGMNIGVSALASGRVPEAETMLAEAGFNKGDVNIVAAGTGSQAAGALTTGKIDGLFLWDQAYATLESQGIKIRIIRDVFPDSSKLLDYLQFFSSDMVKNKPEVVAKYGRAMAKGLLWSINNPAGALDLFYKEFPAYKASNEGIRDADLYALTSYANQHSITGTDYPGFGYFPDDYVSFTAQFLKDAGKLGDYKEPGIFYTNQFMEEYNKFDHDAVIKAAKEYKPSWEK